jgi:hypothetical protein
MKRQKKKLLKHISTEHQLPIRPFTHKPYKDNTEASTSGRSSAGKYNQLYTLPRWRKIRANQLKREPLCKYCMDAGTTTSATICDHIEPHRGNMIKFWSGPFQSLCKSCHDSHKKAFEQSGRVIKRIGVDGYPVEQQLKERIDHDI